MQNRSLKTLLRTYGAILILALTACGSGTALPQPTASMPPETTATPLAVTPTEAISTSIPSPTPGGSSTPAASPTATNLRLNLTNPAVVTLAKDLPGPDDLVLAPDGSIYISDISTGRIQELKPDSSLQTLISGLSIPEGMAILPDGSLLIAEQGKNRLVRYDPKNGKLVPFLDLPNKTGLEGVDGIVLDNHQPGNPSIIIPDSPNGTVLRAGIDGQNLSTIAKGFARPTGAWVEPDGSILVPDENGGALKRIRPDGKVENLADFSIPDDVIEDNAGNIFVVTLGDGAIHILPSAGGNARVLVSGLSSPQGILFDRDGNLVVTDPGHHRLVKIIILLP